MYWSCRKYPPNVKTAFAFSVCVHEGATLNVLICGSLIRWTDQAPIRFDHPDVQVVVRIGILKPGTREPGIQVKRIILRD